MSTGPSLLFVLTVTPIDRLHKSDGPNGVKGAAEEDKICDKAWRAQDAHVYRSKEGRAHPLCEPLTERRPRLAHQVSENLLRKEETCPARMKLALQG